MADAHEQERRRRYVLARIRGSKPEITLDQRPHRFSGAASFPLLSGQQRLWFLHQLRPTQPIYNEAILLSFEGTIDPAVLEQALSRVVESQESLRTKFVESNGEIVQTVVAGEAFKLAAQLDLSELPESERPTRLDQIVREQASIPFDLSTPRLLKAVFIRVSGSASALLLVNHHIICDALSRNIIAKQLARAYVEIQRSGTSDKDEIYSMRHSVEAEIEASERSDFTEKLEFWAKKLSGGDKLNLISDFSRPAVENLVGSRVSGELSEQQTEAIKLLARKENCTPFAVCCAIYCITLYIHSGEREFVIGVPVSGREDIPNSEKVVGFFANTIPLPVRIDPHKSFLEILTEIKSRFLEALQHNVPFESIVRYIKPSRDLSASPLFQVSFGFQPSVAELCLGSSKLTNARSIDFGFVREDLNLEIVLLNKRYSLELGYRTDLFRNETAAAFINRYLRFARELTSDPALTVGELELASEGEKSIIIGRWSRGSQIDHAIQSVVGQFQAQVRKTPNGTAVKCDEGTLSWAELHACAKALSASLAAQGAGKGSRVCLAIERGPKLLCAIWAIIGAGCAYVPVDPEYPLERIKFIVEDSECALILATNTLAGKMSELKIPIVRCDDCLAYKAVGGAAGDISEQVAMGDDALYVIYTSGSTGKPKGVVVEHRNVVSFFSAMDEMLGSLTGAWLAMTSVAFDISVLELLWTSCRGITIILPSRDGAASMLTPPNRHAQNEFDFSLSFFSSNVDETPGNRYGLLLNCARYADEHGFKAIWIPERHFHQFGGLFPNPAVVSAALARETQNIQIRAGSVVAPLHHPLRIAEEWAVVDNLSKGRIGIAFAAGWHADDFVFSPDSFGTRYANLEETVENVRRLWRGEACTFRNGLDQFVEVRIQPAPMQKELPFWITASNSIETFKLAGRLGAGILTHLLGQSFDELEEKIAIYHIERSRAGHDGRGSVVLMLHSYVGIDDKAAQDMARTPMKQYLGSSLDLVKNLARGLGYEKDVRALSSADRDAILDLAFVRYASGSSLIGSEKTCLETLERIRAIGVTEAACLVDFGLDENAISEGLVRLKTVVQKFRQEKAQVNNEDPLLKAVLEGARHFQVTPSVLSSRIKAPKARAAMRSFDNLIVGGEPLPAELALELRNLQVRATNVYGPTETTVWSSYFRLTNETEILIGKPLANTTIYILSDKMKLVGPGLIGEIYIGGRAVARGYLNRPELSAERFIRDPFSAESCGRMYRTGDMAGWTHDGRIRFFGRRDTQVKIRGYRIELGEVESIACRHPDIKQCIATVWMDAQGDAKLVAYLMGHFPIIPTPAEMRRFYLKSVPTYLVPNYFIQIDQLPLSSNGKLERNRLPPPILQDKDSEGEAPEALEDELTSDVCKVWAGVLGVSRVKPSGNFFDLGGHSLLAVKLINRCRDTFEVHFGLTEFFMNPTVAGMVTTIREQRKPSRQ